MSSLSEASFKAQKRIFIVSKSGLYMQLFIQNLEKLVEGDKVVLPCIASRYKYESVKWYKINEKLNESLIFENRDVKYSESQFSHIVNMTFDG